MGKSTLINKLIGEKITITSPIAQTTRNKLKGILTTKNGQIIFVDTPGVHKPHHRLGEILVKNAKSAIDGVDMVIFVIDSSEEPGRGDEYIMNFLVANKTEFIVVLNKWDLVNKEFRNLRIDQYRRFFGINRRFQIVSASEGEGCSELIKMIITFLPEGPKLYDEEMICDQPLDNLLSDLVREQVLKNTREEVPHSVAVKIEKREEMKRKMAKFLQLFWPLLSLKDPVRKVFLLESKVQC